MWGRVEDFSWWDLVISLSCEWNSHPDLAPVKLVLLHCWASSLGWQLHCYKGTELSEKVITAEGMEVSQVPKASPTESFEDHGNNLHLDSEIVREPVWQNDAFTVACVAKQTSSCFCSSGSSFHIMYFSVLDTMRCSNQSGGHTFVDPCCQVSVW